MFCVKKRRLNCSSCYQVLPSIREWYWIFKNVSALQLKFTIQEVLTRRTQNIDTSWGYQMLDIYIYIYIYIVTITREDLQHRSPNTEGRLLHLGLVKRLIYDPLGLSKWTFCWGLKDTYCTYTTDEKFPAKRSKKSACRELRCLFVGSLHLRYSVYFWKYSTIFRHLVVDSKNISWKGDSAVADEKRSMKVSLCKKEIVENSEKRNQVYNSFLSTCSLLNCLMFTAGGMAW